MYFDEFDGTDSVLQAGDFREKNENLPKTCLSFFSKSIIDLFLNNYSYEIVDYISNANMKFPVYKCRINEVEILVFQAAVGASACVSNFEELIHMGVEKIVLVGSCGCLINMEEFMFVLPTFALRDEGTSFHYLKASDEVEIDVRMMHLIKLFFEENSICFNEGKVWTTDAIFRETRNKITKARDAGAIAVDMECSAMQAVAYFRNIHFGQIFYTLDNLSSDVYAPRHMIEENDSSKSIEELILSICLDCASIIAKKEF